MQSQFRGLAMQFKGRSLGEYGKETYDDDDYDNDDIDANNYIINNNNNNQWCARAHMYIK